MLTYLFNLRILALLGMTVAAIIPGGGVTVILGIALNKKYHWYDKLKGWFKKPEVRSNAP